MNLPEAADLGLILAQKESKFVIVMLIIVTIGNKFLIDTTQSGIKFFNLRLYQLFVESLKPLEH